MFLVQFKGSLSELKPMLTEKVTLSIIKSMIEKQTDVYELKLDTYLGDEELWSELFSGLITSPRHYNVQDIETI